MTKVSLHGGTGSTAVPFHDAEEAWFWFVRCQVVRREGAHLKSAGQGGCRPCDPDDIYRALMRLLRVGTLCQCHLRVLGEFGLKGRPPDARDPQEGRAFKLWYEALDRLTTILSEKGVIQ